MYRPTTIRRSIGHRDGTVESIDRLHSATFDVQHDQFALDGRRVDRAAVLTAVGPRDPRASVAPARSRDRSDHVTCLICRFHSCRCWRTTLKRASSTIVCESSVSGSDESASNHAT